MQKNKTIKLSVVAAAAISSLLISQQVLADVTKEGTEVTVTEPEVEVTRSGDHFYSEVNVGISTDIPDEVAINEGDSLTMSLPQELELETSYQFPVTNGEQVEVGQATADAKTNSVTTVFNEYFQTHPLNKSISLNLQSKINTKVVTEEKKLDLNFSGTIISMETGPKGDTNPYEELYKWGRQDKEDPNTVHWVARINYRKQFLTNVQVSDTWDNGGEYIPGSMRISYLHSANPWTYSHAGDASAVQYRANGFDVYLGTLDRVVTLEYSVRYKDQTRTPNNTVRVTGDNYFLEHLVTYKWISGSGTADGRRTTWDIPNDAPKVEIPEYPLDEVPTVSEVPNNPPIQEELPEGQIPWLIPNNPPVQPELPAAELPDEPEKPSETPVAEAKEKSGATEPVKLVTATEEQLPQTGVTENIFLMTFGVGLLISAFAMLDIKNKK